MAKPNNDSGRRIKRVILGSDFMPMVFKTGLIFEVGAGIPEGAQFRGFVIDQSNNSIVMFLEHPSFDLVPYSDRVPELLMSFTTIKKERD
ncbi:MAG: hypothetical protein ACXWQE_00170 [Bdellovibrionales bacterium]